MRDLDNEAKTRNGKVECVKVDKHNPHQMRDFLNQGWAIVQEEGKNVEDEHNVLMSKPNETFDREKRGREEKTENTLKQITRPMRKEPRGSHGGSMSNEVRITGR